MYMWGSQEKTLGQKVNVKFFRAGPLNAWKVIPINCQGAQGHFGSHLTLKAKKQVLTYRTYQHLGFLGEQ